MNVSLPTARYKQRQPRPLFRLFSVFFKQTIQFLFQINVKNVIGLEPMTS